MDSLQPHLVVLCGAGLSADSGLATFRDSGGLWEGSQPEDVATPEAWQARPAHVWRFYQLRRAQLAGVEPNAAHRALAECAQHLEAQDCGFTLVTQNVDDLHERVGSRALHMHGELAVLRCEACERRRRDLEHLDPRRFVACAACGHARLRPDVVWFGEVPYHLDEIELALRRATHFLAVGTSGQVWPAAGFLEMARAWGAATWVQALERPANLHPEDSFVAGRAAEVLPGLLDTIQQRMGDLRAAGS